MAGCCPAVCEGGASFLPAPQPLFGVEPIFTSSVAPWVNAAAGSYAECHDEPLSFMLCT